MPTEEELAWLLAVLALAQRYENRVTSEVRRTLLRSMYDFRRLVQEMSPDGVFRVYEWSQLQPQLDELFAPIDDALWDAFPDPLFIFQNQTTEKAREFVNNEVRRDLPWTRGELMATTLVAGVTLQGMLRSDRTSRLSARMARDADKLVRTKLLQQEPTTAIANKVMRLARRNGKAVFTSRGGTFTNQMNTRVKNLVAGAMWDVNNRAQLRVFEKTGVQLWRWNATLDPRTCPVCRPLHNKLVPRPTSFVSTKYGTQQPPIHPNCRCFILPVLGTVGQSN